MMFAPCRRHAASYYLMPRYAFQRHAICRHCRYLPRRLLLRHFAADHCHNVIRFAAVLLLPRHGDATSAAAL